jgi:hypothetical protein
VPTLNYTTMVPVSRTAGEVQALLAEAGADAVAIKYVAKQPVGVSFVLLTPHGQRSFDLPVDVAGVRRLLSAQASSRAVKSHAVSRSVLTSPEHAARVAWRIAKDWLEAQLALIQAGMAQLDQVMLPYLRVDGGQSLYELYRANETKALEGSTDA